MRGSWDKVKLPKQKVMRVLPLQDALLEEAAR